MKAWKVFSEHDGELWSACKTECGSHKEFHFRYDREGKNVPDPRFGEFFCFTRKDSTQNFARDVDNPVIKHVEIEKGTFRPLVCMYAYEVADFWSEIHSGKESVYGSTRVIPFTVFAKSLIILE